MELVKIEYDIKNRKFVIEISEKVLTSRITEDYFLAQLIRSVPYAMIADELIRRTREMEKSERQKI